MRLSKKEVLKTPMLEICITGKCNMDCPICLYWKEMHEFETISLKKIEEIVKSAKTNYIILSGGEPTCREDLPDIIRMINSYKKVPILLTNGIKLANDKYLKLLLSSGFFKAYISFDSFRPEVNKKFRGNKKVLELKLRALKNLEKYDVLTIISAVIQKGVNEDEIKDLIEFGLKQKNVETVRLGAIHLKDGTNGISKDELEKIVSHEFNFDRNYFKKFRNFRKKLFSIFTNKPELVENEIYPFKIGSLRPIGLRELFWCVMPYIFGWDKGMRMKRKRVFSVWIGNASFSLSGKRLKAIAISNIKNDGCINFPFLKMVTIY